ncbi:MULTISPECIES: anthranilate synthase [Bartonella]|uniref:anthranilate synthase n=1 Tax=Bartonella TaxID=773 RepID=UPI001FF05CD0|nr:MULTISPECIES: anthranilate synthase [Bartonella]
MEKNMAVEKAFEYRTKGNIKVSRSCENIAYESAIDKMVDALDSHRGAIFSSNYEYPGRYTRWDSGIIDPPIAITSRGRHMKIEALNERGQIILDMIEPRLEILDAVEATERTSNKLAITVKKPGRVFSEEERSRMPSVFSLLRAICDIFHSTEDQSLGLYGAFGYDLAFQFEPIEFKIKRPDDQRDMVLYLPDSILIVDHYSARAWIENYEFSEEKKTTKGLIRHTEEKPFKAAKAVPQKGDHEKGEYAALVREAKESFKRGDLFEVVPGQTFYEACPASPSAISRRLKLTNPSPYSFFINLGEQEYLVGASPEMYVRVTGRRVETCPISGTIKRGQDAIADSEQILALLNSKKDESELTMCSDVDRNDKSRVCEPGSVRVIGRRQIEMYSRLIHTVDHIEGRLQNGLDAFDAFLSHAWAVTVTGAPKLWAMRFIENHERSARAWYAGAIGMIFFNGDMNTGLTLRTVRIKDGVASVRAGATLLYDSIPEEEEKETELKASAMIAAIRDSAKPLPKAVRQEKEKPGTGVNILLVDHEDSFVHTLANYFRETGAKVTTVRSPVDEKVFETVNPDLVVLSPGPGTPKDFNCEDTINKARARKIPIFGVCLGLQALTEAFGGSLRVLDQPMHGKPSRIHITGKTLLFKDLPKEITVGRYHSIFADPSRLPSEFNVTAETADGVIMAIEHKSQPIAAVQFHPESIMSLGGNVGMAIIENVVSRLIKKAWQ